MLHVAFAAKTMQDPTLCFLVSIRRDTCSFVVVVELHVGPSDSVMRSGIKIRYLAHAHISWFWRLTRMSAYEKHVYVILENKRRRRNPYYALSLAAFWSVDVNTFLLLCWSSA